MYLYSMNLEVLRSDLSDNVRHAHLLMCDLVLSHAVEDAYDYLGRSYLHVPQDVEVDLRTDEPPDKCFVPKKLIYCW